MIPKKLQEIINPNFLLLVDNCRNKF